MLHGLDLFSGIGGLTLALSEWVRPIAYCENDPYVQAVLLQNMSNKVLPCAPIWDDIRTLNSSLLPPIDIVYGGFPCQDISVAGHGRGLEGKRSGLVFEVLRLIDETAPTFVFLENVPAIRTRGAERVGKEMARLGYDCRWDVISAQEIGAPHRRERWFLLSANTERIELWDESRRWSGPHRDGQAVPGNYGKKEFVADSESMRRRQRNKNTYGSDRSIENKKERDRFAIGSKTLATSNGIRGSNIHRGISEKTGKESESGFITRSCGKTLANTYSKRFQIGLHRQAPKDERATASRNGWWAIEPDVGRVAYGLPNRVDRIRGLGNAVVPLQAREAFKRLMGVEIDDDEFDFR